MRQEPKKRIDTNPAQAGLNAAFSDLKLDPAPLPAGPAPTPLPAAPQAVWKMGRVVLRREGLALPHHGLCNLPGEVSLAVERAGGDEGDRHA